MSLVNVGDVFIQKATNIRFVVEKVDCNARVAYGKYDGYTTFIMFSVLNQAYYKSMKDCSSRVGTKQFQKGDIVRCIDSIGAWSLDLNKEYVVVDIGRGRKQNQLYLNTEYTGGYSAYRFVVAKEAKQVTEEKESEFYSLTKPGVSDAKVKKITEVGNKWIVEFQPSKHLAWAHPSQCKPWVEDYTVAILPLSSDLPEFHVKTSEKNSLKVGDTIRSSANYVRYRVTAINTKQEQCPWFRGVKITRTELKCDE